MKFKNEFLMSGALVSTPKRISENMVLVYMDCQPYFSKRERKYVADTFIIKCIGEAAEKIETQGKKGMNVTFTGHLHARLKPYTNKNGEEKFARENEIIATAVTSDEFEESDYTGGVDDE